MVRTLCALSLFLTSALTFCVDETVSNKQFLKSLVNKPTSSVAHMALAHLYKEQKLYTKAIAHYQKALRHNKQFPNCVHAYRALIQLLRKQKRYDDAILVAQQAAALFEQDISLLFNLAFCATVTGKITIALDTYERILQRQPNNANVLYNMGFALKMSGNPRAAIRAYQKAIEADPTNKKAEFALALAQLNAGDLQKGWKRYEQEQLGAGSINAEKLHTWLKNGQLADKRILVHFQGGFGDTMHFCRYLKELKNRGAYIILTTKKPLVPLMSLCPYIDEIVLAGGEKPPFHSQTTVMALPSLFNSSEETIPRDIPYLFADEQLTKEWEEFFQRKNNGKLQIGLNWGADAKNDECRPPAGNRSIPVELLHPLDALNDVADFYCLQKGVTEISMPQGNLNIKTFGPDFDRSHGAFMDTAAIMKQLDLVITVDTSIAHLAGALGVPVFVLLPYCVDWRWIAGRTDSPWYPTMKLFQQKIPMSWEPVVQNVVTEIKKSAPQQLLARGNKLYSEHKFEEALQLFEQLNKHYPNNFSILHNIGFTLAELNKPHEALKKYEHALELKPDHIGLHFNTALAYLAAGDYKKGWQEYEWRWQHHGKNLQDLPFEIWNNENLVGKTILLRCEGALGDCMQFIRYAQLVKKCGATVVVQTLPPLKKLLSLCPYIDQIISTEETIPDVDFQISLMSLPHKFETEINTVPNKTPYLYADETLTEKWSQLFDPHVLNIGICWQADQHNDAQRPPLAKRSVPVALFAELAHAPGVKLFNLQKNSDEEIEFDLHDFGPDFDTTNGRFMDTAAVIKQLDLVITVDTSIAHLAGALGTQTWVLLPFKSDWRWMTERTDSPWYPNMKLYRNEKTTWNLLIKQVTEDFEKTFRI